MMDLTDGKGKNTSYSASASARIIGVGSVSSDSLDINFDNGSILLLSTQLILALPGFDILAKDDRIYYPKTDGASIYWSDGPRHLSVTEILELVGNPGDCGKC